MAKRKSLKIGLVVNEKRDASFGKEYFHILVRPVLLGLNEWEMRQIDNGANTHPEATSRTVRGFSSNDITNGLALDGLTISCQGDSDTREQGRLYGFSVEYRDVYSVDQTRAENMARTLRTIQKRLDKYTEKFGYHGDDYGNFVARVANAIGATEILFDRSTKKHGYYTEAEWQRFNIGDGASHINWRVRQWANPEAEKAVSNG